MTFCQLTLRRFTLGSLICCSLVSLAAEEFIPRKQTSVPGPALTPEQAIAKMKVPEGFRVELVAAEPDLQNPVAMAFDRRGRIWVTESFEYPRREPGPGRDRIKILEDTDHDGRVDSVKIFAEGLNIPSGIAIGHGGVWVGNSPDILFLEDTDGDDKADRQRAVVTGFGRTDTHELPNAFTWSPDGNLMGLNGVFNECLVTQDDRTYKFNAALWRIQPRSGRFDLFCEGTSNPWGVAYDTLGNAFVSACVIDHLWHLTETGYYHRQAGAYPPYTWKIESIVDHAHQLAAYCGLHYFDSPAYPDQYRNRLYMGNIHGGCLNVDRLERRGSTYLSHGEDDFLTANDVWFMPVSVQGGPDGSMYVLDWYDRYHCYQDANHDPKGVDRGHGRLYRIRYGDTPRAGEFNLEKESSAQLAERLKDENSYFRDMARQILAERADPQIRATLQAQTLDDKLPLKTRLSSLWALIGTHQPLVDDFHLSLLQNSAPELRMWGVRAAGNQGTASAAVLARVQDLATDSSADVRLQVAIAVTKLPSLPQTKLLLQVAAATQDDVLIPRIVWKNLHGLLPRDSQQLSEALATYDLGKSKALQAILPRAIEKLLDDPAGAQPAALVAQRAIARPDGVITQATLELFERRTLAGELPADRRGPIVETLSMDLAKLRGVKDSSTARAAVRLSALWGDSLAINAAWQAFESAKQPEDQLSWLPILARAAPERLAHEAPALLARTDQEAFVTAVLQALSAIDNPVVGRTVLTAYAKLPAAAKPKAIELLTQRAAWSKDLLTAVREERIPRNDIGASALLRLAAQPDAELKTLVEKTFGAIRTDRNPARQQVIEKIRQLTSSKSGDPVAGRQVFTRVCGQCHQMHGEGHQVGPDITRNGRGNYDQLLSNVLDPNLVIGQGYQTRTVLTTDGRVLTGLLVENNEQRIVLNVQGGKRESIPRDQIEEDRESKLSLMPEALEEQLKEQELLDLFAYLTIETPPGTTPVTRLPGTPAKLHK